jgi:hypothetical protein
MYNMKDVERILTETLPKTFHDTDAEIVLKV